MLIENFPPAGSPLPETITVLVVDNDQQIRQPLVRMLSRAGLTVGHAASVEQGVACHADRKFDVIISDIRMPGGDGFDLMRAVRRNDLDVPIVLMTAMPDVATAMTAVELGAYRYLIKPIQQEPLLAVLRQAARTCRMAKLRRAAHDASGRLRRSWVDDRAALETRFAASLRALWIAYQPIIGARSGALFGVEALLRSDEPSMSTPPMVLDAAQQLGRLVELGRRTRKLAATALASDRPGTFLFVNLHPCELMDDDLLSSDTALGRVASRVVLEITERDALESTPTLRDRLTRLREMGFRLAIDDLGAGYSGLTTFADVMPEVVKIDISLVRNIDRSDIRKRTVRHLCALAHDCGGLVVGEGVETQSEHDCLRELGCDLIQGYLIGRPARELPTWRSADTLAALRRLARPSP